MTSHQQAAKKYLSQLFKLRAELNANNRLVRKWERRAASIPGSTSGTAKVSATRGRGSFENAAVEASDLGAECQRLIALIAEKQREIEAAIAAVDDPVYRKLLTYRYIYGLSWGDVAGVMGYSKYHVSHDLHLEALESLGCS